MANILEFLRAVITDGDEQRRFAASPREYLIAHGFDDLTGEDVVEGISALRSSLPDDVAAQLSAYDGSEHPLPEVVPGPGESELDAAIRVLDHVTVLNPAGASDLPPPPPPPPYPPDPALADPYPAASYPAASYPAAPYAADPYPADPYPADPYPV
ncbi:MAG: hypothetical protein ABIV94_06175, partial [Acidimicrobiales bacterium]